jgi:3'-phosphoadenosine 5'-phosphosulfate sulfotransferase (PAPS reductase)/FAD synthetase
MQAYTSQEDFAHSSGFSSWEEMCRMVASVDVSTPDRMERFRAWQEGDGTKGMLEFVIARNNTAGDGDGSATAEQAGAADEAEDEFSGLGEDQEITIHVPGSTGTLKRLGLLATPRIVRLLKRENAPCAFSVSGGKDGSAAAIAGIEYLNSIGHTGARILEHCDLGLIEHRDSIKACERLAKALDTELVVVKPIRDMIEAWRYRWECNVERYAKLLCMKLIMPWSSSSMRFCTPLKVDALTREAARRFRGRTILSVTGIRREESHRRAKTPVSKWQPRLSRAASRTGAYSPTRGLDWHPVAHYMVEHVFGVMLERGVRWHEKYDSLSRISCALCVLAGRQDLQRSARMPENYAACMEVVALELESAFSFQEGCWVADLVPEYLDARMRAELAEAKERARVRQEAESRIPRHLLYNKHWPEAVPTPQEAELISRIRATVSGVTRITIDYVDPTRIVSRFTELMAKKESLRPSACAAVNEPTQATLFGL